MYQYTIIQWFLFLFIYSFIGWIIESAIVSFNSRRLVNRGFLHGPVLPIYGVGALATLITLLPVRGNLVQVYFAGAIAATLLEFAAGCLLEVIFKIKYWDYSNNRFQYKGKICLSSTLFWGLLSVVLIEWLHNPVEKLVDKLSIQQCVAVVSVIGVIMTVDCIVSAKAAFNLTKALENLAKIKEEVDRLQEIMETKMQHAAKGLGEIKENANKELVEIKERLAGLRDEQDSFYNKFGKGIKNFFKSFPSAKVKSIKLNDLIKDSRDKWLNRNK